VTRSDSPVSFAVSSPSVPTSTPQRLNVPSGWDDGLGELELGEEDGALDVNWGDDDWN
jgi:hypothetical protein